MTGNKPTFKVDILYNSRHHSCDASCGLDWSDRSNAEMARRQISARFKNEIRFNITDLGSGDTSEPNMNQDLPKLLIDDVLRISGPFDLRQMLDAIEAQLEIKNERV